jgi:hypothetical protein
MSEGHSFNTLGKNVIYGNDGAYLTYPIPEAFTVIASSLLDLPVTLVLIKGTENYVEQSTIEALSKHIHCAYPIILGCHDTLDLNKKVAGYKLEKPVTLIKKHVGYCDAAVQQDKKDFFRRMREATTLPGFRPLRLPVNRL